MATVVAVGPSARAAMMVEAWGTGTAGQLGNGAAASSASPVAVTGLTAGVTAVSGGGTDSFAVQNGAALAWGDNRYGELGDGGGSNASSPVAVNVLTSGVTAIAGGYRHGLAIRNGAAYAWGYNQSGEVGDGTTTMRLSPVAVNTLTSGVTAVAAGTYASLAIRNGAAYTWGGNVGSLGTGTAPAPGSPGLTTPTLVSGLSSGVTAIATGTYHAMAVQTGAAFAWGDNTYGELGNGTTTTSDLVPVAVSGLTSGVTAVACGLDFSLALQGGTVYAWGENDQRQLASNAGAFDATPAAVQGISGTVVAIGAGGSSGYAVTSDGSLWDWGSNRAGQLGLGNFGTTPTYATPQRVPAPAGYAYTSVASSMDNGQDHVVALLAAPDAAVTTVAAHAVLGTVTPAGNGAAGYGIANLSLGAGVTTGSVQIAGNLASDATGTELVLLDLADPTQTAALVADLDALYGGSYASALSSDPFGRGYDVVLAIPATAATPDYFNFDLGTVLNAGAGGDTVGSVAITNIAVVPEPATASGAIAASLGLLARRRRRVDGRRGPA